MSNANPFEVSDFAKKNAASEPVRFPLRSANVRDRMLGIARAQVFVWVLLCLQGSVFIGAVVVEYYCGSRISNAILNLNLPFPVLLLVSIGNGVSAGILTAKTHNAPMGCLTVILAMIPFLGYFMLAATYARGNTLLRKHGVKLAGSGIHIKALEAEILRQLTSESP